MLRFSKDIIFLFPKGFLLMVVLLLVQGVFASLTVVSVAPIVDLFLHPDLNGASVLTQKLTETLKRFGIPGKLEMFIAMFLLAILLKNSLFILVQYVNLRIKYHILFQLVSETLNTFYKARWVFFTKTSQGKIFNTFLTESQRTGDCFGQLGLLIANCSQVMIFLVVPLVISWKITLFCAGLAGLFAIPVILLGKLNYRLGERNVANNNILMGTLKELVDSAKIIIGYGNRKLALNRYQHSFDTVRKVTVKADILGTSMPLIYEPLGMIALFSTLLISRFLVISLAEVAVVIWGLKNMIPFIGAAVSNLNVVKGLLPSYEQIQNMRLEAREWQAPRGHFQFNKISQEIEVRDVSFGYPEQENTIHNLNLLIPCGKMIAFVGSSGSGKSTLVDLILGLNVPSTGYIVLDGVYLSEYDPESYRQKIGYVPQDPVLFNLSIRDNLRWANPEADAQSITAACDQAYATEFIEKLPQRHDTIIGDRGVRLSGGQCQRLVLARALVRKPELLVLDEATSALDTQSEQFIQQAIDDLAGHTTIIVVAHRLSTIVKADYIYLLADGKVAAQGKYDELIQQNEQFLKMVKLQQLPSQAG
jgi:ABC-type multidrug transport system fused ATPase/permease subunit